MAINDLDQFAKDYAGNANQAASSDELNQFAAQHAKMEQVKQPQDETLGQAYLSEAKGFTQGMVNPTLRLADIAANVARYASPIPEQFRPIPYFKVPQVDIAPSTPSAKAGEFLGSMVGLSPLGKLQAATAIPELAASSPMLARAITGATQGGLAGLLTSPAGTSGVAPTAIGAMLGAPMAMVTGTMPALLTSKKSPINIINQVKPHIENAVNDIKTKLLGGEDVNQLPQSVFKKVKDFRDEMIGDKADADAYKYINPQESVSNLYDQASDKAQNLNLQYSKDAIHDSINKIGDNLSAQMERVSKKSDEYKNYQNILNKIETYRPRTPEGEPYILADPETGQMVQKPGIPGTEGARVESFDDAKALKEDLNQAWKQANLENNLPLQNALSDVKTGVRQSIKDSAAGNPELSDLLQKADSRYAQVKKQFDVEPNGKTITPFAKLNKMPNPEGAKEMDNFIGSYLVPGAQRDNANQLNKLMNMLPDQDSKNLVTSWYFRNANNSQDFMKLYDKLGSNQRNLLFSPEDRQQLDVLHTLYKNRPEAFTPMPTQDTKNTRKLAEVAATASGITALLTGHPLVALGLLAEPTARAISAAAPKLNPDLIKNYIAQRTATSPDVSRGTQFLIRSIPTLYNAMIGRNQNANNL